MPVTDFTGDGSVFREVDELRREVAKWRGGLAVLLFPLGRRLRDLGGRDAQAARG